VQFRLRDHDSEFSAAFDEGFRSESVQVPRSPPPRRSSDHPVGRPSRSSPVRARRSVEVASAVGSTSTEGCLIEVTHAM